MQSLDGKVTSQQLTAAEWNEVPGEIQEVIENAGIVLSGADLTQLSKGIMNLLTGGQFLNATGTMPNKVLTPVSPRKGTTALVNGMVYRFRSVDANSASGCQVNPSGHGFTDVFREDGTPLRVGDIAVGIDAVIRYDSSSGGFFALLNPQANPFFPDNYIEGFHAINSTAAVAVKDGSAADSTNTVMLRHPLGAGVYSSKTNVAWAAGTGAGGVAGGAFIAGEFRPFFIIGDDEGNTDYGWDSFANRNTAATLLADASTATGDNWVYFRRIHWTFVTVGILIDTTMKNDAYNPDIWTLQQPSEIYNISQDHGTNAITVAPSLLAPFPLETEITVNIIWLPNAAGDLLHIMGMNDTTIVPSAARGDFEAFALPGHVQPGYIEFSKTLRGITVGQSATVSFRTDTTSSTRVQVIGVGFRDDRGRHGA